MSNCYPEALQALVCTHEATQQNTCLHIACTAYRSLSLSFPVWAPTVIACSRCQMWSHSVQPGWWMLGTQHSRNVRQWPDGNTIVVSALTAKQWRSYICNCIGPCASNYQPGRKLSCSSLVSYVILGTWHQAVRLGTIRNGSLKTRQVSRSLAYIWY